MTVSEHRMGPVRYTDFQTLPDQAHACGSL